MNNFFGINHIAKLINRLLLLMSSSDIDPIYTSYCRKCKEEYGIIRPHIRKTGRPYQFKHHVHKDLESIIENKPSNPDLNTLISSSYLFCDTCWKWILKKMKGLPLELVPVPPLSCDVCGIDDCLGIYTIPLWRGNMLDLDFIHCVYVDIVILLENVSGHYHLHLIYIVEMVMVLTIIYGMSMQKQLFE